MVDKKAGVITLPAQFVKQGRDHTVAITPALSAVLDGCTVDARSDLVFPSVKTGGKMSGWHKQTAAFVKSSGVPFTFHDLRRTIRTGLSRLDVSTEIAELALGHARENLIEIYDRNNGSAAVRDAFARWADHVVTVTAPDLGVFG
jgi:integrase